MLGVTLGSGAANKTRSLSSWCLHSSGGNRKQSNEQTNVSQGKISAKMENKVRGWGINCLVAILYKIARKGLLISWLSKDLEEAKEEGGFPHTEATACAKALGTELSKKKIRSECLQLTRAERWPGNDSGVGRVWSSLVSLIHYPSDWLFQVLGLPRLSLDLPPSLPLSVELSSILFPSSPAGVFQHSRSFPPNLPKGQPVHLINKEIEQ